MAYNKAKEEYKWKVWKEQEEKKLRELGVSEEVIAELRDYDWNCFKQERNYKNHQMPDTDFIEIIFGTRIYVQILVLQGFVELSDVVKSGGIYSVRNAFATRLQQKYLKNIGHFSVIDTGECPFCYADFVSAVTLSSFSKVLLIASTRICISK